MHSTLHTLSRRPLLLDVLLASVAGNGAGAAQAQAAPTWSPRVDIHEDKEKIIIRADLPGIDPAAIEVKLDKNELVIQGKRELVEEEQMQRVTGERWHGQFKRTFRLGEQINKDGISAEGKNGVLEVTIPKIPEEVARQIPVR